MEQIRRAEALDPLFRHYFRSAGLILMLAGRDEEAVSQYRRALELDSTFIPARELSSDALARLGRYDEALHEWQVALVIDGDDSSAAIVAAARGESGYREAIRKIATLQYRRMRRESTSGQYVPQSRLADVLLSLGDREGAITALEHAVEIHDPYVIALPYDPKYRDIQSDPRVLALQRRMNLPR